MSDEDTIGAVIDEMYAMISGPAGRPTVQFPSSAQSLSLSGAVA